MNKIVKAYTVSMSYDISDEEKLQAEKALICFNYAVKMLDLSKDHLDIMKTPFKDSQGTSPEEIMKARAAIRRFRDKSIENFNNFKLASFKCVNIMQSFASDTQTVKVMKSFVASVDTLEDKVNKFADLFNDLQDQDFSKNIVASIEDIQEECDSIEEIIEERIKNHIKNNILASTWVNSVSDELQMKLEQKTPIILDLFNKRQDQLNDIIKERSSQSED